MSKTLYDELHPEVNELLEQDKEQFPNLYASIVSDIKNATFITDLPLGTSNSLVNYYKAAKIKTDNEYSDSFMLQIYEVFQR